MVTTVRDYLSSRFSKSNALTRKEALLIGLAWPLTKGWVERFGGVEIADDKVPKLLSIANVRASKKNADKAAHKESKRLNKLVAVGAMTIADAKSAMVEFVAAERPKKQSVKPVKKDGFYESREWRELRYKALVINGASCQCCGATRADGVRLHVDHIKPRSKFPKLQLELSNLQVLCEDCNLGKSNKDITDWR